MANKNLNCFEFYSIVSEYYDGHLDAKDKELFEQHFDSCELCQKFFESFRSTMGVITGPIKTNYDRVQFPQEMEDKIVTFLLKRNSG